ncbi:redoxin family protein [Planctomicrobium sp. SH661]|uniref:redoxin family protein n=1 Tax=Planctomicrobium sp. SH661 TaxID=3448124 RepID=UPI003F5C5BC6
MRARSLFQILGFLVVLGTVCHADAPSQSRLKIGEVAPNWTFTDTHYLPRTLSDFGKKRAYVVVFTTLQCPVVRRSLPLLKAMEEKFRDQEVQFLALNVGVSDPIVEVAWQALKADLPFAVGKDFEGEAAAMLGVLRTPEVVVLDSDFRLRYRGRIGTQVRIGGINPGTAREDLQLAIEDVLAGREVAVPETPVDGCQIEFDGLRTLPASVPEQVTFNEHIAPLLAKHCQDCHRPGTAAPFSLITYSDAISHAGMIAEVVRSGQMPPHFASREHGKFENLREMSPQDRALIMAWAQKGKVEGDPAKLPPPREFSQLKWKIGEPDLVIQTLVESEIPATGVLPYRIAVLPTIFLKDTWVQRVEILPSNLEVMHHCNLGYVRPGEKVSTQNLISGYVPGGEALVLEDGVGQCIPAGSLLVLQMHYVPTGEATTDRTSVGIVFAKEKIQKRLQHAPCINHHIAIPPGDPHFPLSASEEINCNATGVGMFTHMHLRGKDMVFEAIDPAGKREILLAIPNYDFNWQMFYRWPKGTKKFAKGTRIQATAHFDNSVFNPFNPDPTVTVKEGDQSFDEMMYAFLFYTDDDEQLNLDIDPKTGHVRK